MGIKTSRKAHFLICSAVATALVVISSPARGDATLTRGTSNLNTAPTSLVAVSYTQAIRLLPAAARELAAREEAFNKALTQNEIAVIALNNSLTVHGELLKGLQAAEVNANDAQSNVDDLARGMYMNGGSGPGIVEVVLTSVPQDSISRALETRTFIETVAKTTVTVSQESKSKVVQATTNTAAAQSEVKLNETQLQEAGETVSQAKAQLVVIQTEYDRLTLSVASPPEGNYDFKGCKNWLVPRLAKAGWEGENLREAWAVVMRESGGREDGISDSNDWGAMQFNKPTWGDASWWDDKLILTLDYNLAIGYQMSDGGRTWYPWGLDGHGRPNAAVYYNSGFSDETVQRTIIEPYLKWYEAFPCTEKDTS